MFWKKKRFWGSLIAIALLVYCVKDIRWQDVVALSHRLSLENLIPALGCSFIFIIAKALRWRLMAARHKKIKIFRAISLYSAGQILNIVMPALTGQVGRIFLFSKNEGMKKTFVFSTIVLEVLFDSLSLIIFLLLTSLAFVFPQEYRSLSYILAALTVILIILLYLLLTFQDKVESFTMRACRERWPGFYVGVKKFIRSFVQGINLLRSSQHFFGSLGYSLLAWITHVLVVFFLLKSFGFRLPFAAAASIMIINTIALMVPITPGNAGTFEVAVSKSLLLFPDVGRTDAILFALALHLLDLLPILILGYIFLHTERVSIAEIKSEHEEKIILDEISEDGTLLEKEEKT